MFLYFSLNQIPSISPSFSGMWQSTTGAVRRVMTSQLNKDPITTGPTINGAGDAGFTYLDRQYITPGLAYPQVIQGRISGQLMVREIAATDNVDRVLLCAKVVSNDGLTLRGVLLDSGNYGPTLEFIATGTHRNKTIASGQIINTITGSQGDRLVFEIGYQHSTAGTTPQASAKWGSLAARLPVNETQTTNGAGWIAVTSDLVFNKTIFIPNQE